MMIEMFFFYILCLIIFLDFHFFLIPQYKTLNYKTYGENDMENCYAHGFDKLSGQLLC